MHLKRYFAYSVLLIVFLLAVLPSVSANFACGRVNSLENFSVSWFKVDLWYIENSVSKTSCLVSPEENKYCCDPRDIKSVSWGIGKIIQAEIFDKGFVSNKVNLSISGEGYDVFEEMNLEKILTIHEPKKTFYLNKTNFYFNLTLNEGFNRLKVKMNYSNDSIEIYVCENCTQIEFVLENITQGEYLFTFISENSDGKKHSEDRKIIIADWLTKTRKLECASCKDGYVYTGVEVNVSIELNASTFIEGRLYDYFPTDWKYVFSEGTLSDFSETHNQIFFDINGTNIIVKYKLKTPDIFFTRQYFFKSNFESYNFSDDKWTVYRFYKIFPLAKKYLIEIIYKDYFSTYSTASNEYPIVMSLNDSNLVLVAIYPKYNLDESYAFIVKRARTLLKNADFHFIIGSDISNNYIDKVLIRYKVNNSENDLYLNSSLLYYYNISGSNWMELNTTRYYNDENESYFETYSSGIGQYAVKNKRVNKDE